MMTYWKDYNNCQVQNIISLPDVNNDGDAGSIYQDSQCLNDVYVELFLMEGMGHDWPTDFNEYDIIAAEYAERDRLEAAAAEAAAARGACLLGRRGAASTSSSD